MMRAIDRAFWLSILAMLVSALVVMPAQARNVPGSVAVVQTQIDQANSSSIIDATLRAVKVPNSRVLTLIDAGAAADSLAGVTPGLESLSAYQALSNITGTAVLSETESSRLSAGFGAGYLWGSPDGYTFDYLSGYGSVVLSHKIAPSTTILGAVIGEAGKGNLTFSNGTLEHGGIGALAGVIVQLNDTIDLSLLGGLERLHYKTTRSGGLFAGDYDAMRYIADAQLKGLFDGGAYYLEYGGGLRYIRQDNDSYREISGGVPGALVNASTSNSLDALANLKVGVPMGTFTPFLQASGNVGLYADASGVKSDQIVSGRIGVGVDAEVMDGTLTLDAGFSRNNKGLMGVDGGLNFAKSF